MRPPARSSQTARHPAAAQRRAEVRSMRRDESPHRSRDRATKGRDDISFGREKALDDLLDWLGDWGKS